MFIPGEQFLSAALEHDNDLWEFAFRQKILLATPTNLIAIARTIDAVWKQEKLAQEARQIGDLGKELYDRLAIVSEHLGRAGNSLNSAVSHFNKATTSYNTNLTSTGRKFRDLKIETGKRDLEDLPSIELAATHVTSEQSGLAETVD
jgi:DNA recombination protein RmuC